MTTPRRTHQADKLAKLYDAEILPIWSQKFGKLMLRHLALPAKAMVLDVGCGTGYPALDILKRMDDQGRLIAIDASSPMLDEARAKAGPLSGKRIFFRSENALPKLSFADDVYDLVVCNAALQDFEDPEPAVRDFSRVTKPGGRVIVTLPLAGTFEEFFDIFREVLIKQDRGDAIDRLDAYLTRFPALEQAEGWFEDAGLTDVQSEFETFRLLFKSSREFFFAPIIEYGPLIDWKAIAGKGKQMQDVFWEAKTAIDSYFSGGSFAVTVVAGCIRGRKAHAEPGRLLIDQDHERLDEEESTGELEELGTGEIEIIEQSRSSTTRGPRDEDETLLDDEEDPDKDPIL
jgi:ubiquinone/menaquinone biosynthesis C-methylase UbiE